MRRLAPALLAPGLCLLTTFNCRTDAITLQPGQNLNKYTLTTRGR